MLGGEASSYAVPVTGPPQMNLSQPKPEQRVVETSDKATSRDVDSQSPNLSPPLKPAQLSNTARQFAAILDTTGSVRTAAMATGFRLTHVDLYA